MLTPANICIKLLLALVGGASSRLGSSTWGGLRVLDLVLPPDVAWVHHCPLVLIHLDVPQDLGLLVSPT